MSKAFELEGTLKEVMETKTFPSGFTKREFVVTEDDDRYPQDIKLSMVKGNCALLDTVKPGDKVRVTFSLRGRRLLRRAHPRPHRRPRPRRNPG